MRLYRENKTKEIPYKWGELGIFWEHSLCWFFLSVHLFLFQSQNQPKRKEDEIVFPPFHQKICWLCWEWVGGTLSLFSFLTVPRLLQGESDKQTLLLYNSIFSPLWPPEITRTSLTGSSRYPDFEQFSPEAAWSSKAGRMTELRCDTNNAVLAAKTAPWEQGKKAAQQNTQIQEHCAASAEGGL